jgi:hypothetical protein
MELAFKGRKTRETEVRKVDGRWVRCGFAFARLEIGMSCSWVPPSFTQTRGTDSDHVDEDMEMD